MIHAVTDGSGLPKSIQKKAAAICSEVEAICIREKHFSELELDKKIGELLKQGVPSHKLIIHSYPALAVYYALQGAHFSEFDERLVFFKQAYPEIKAGQSVHSVASAKQAEADGADYVYFGHIYATPSKKGVPGRGLNSLREITASVSIPVIAIGGLHSGNVQTVFQAGAAGAAMISAFFNEKE